MLLWGVTPATTGSPARGGDMFGKETDLATLLVGVFAVGVGPAAADGPWDATDTAVCIPVLILLWIYTFKIPARQPEKGSAERLAVATVFGFIFSIGLAWPSQSAFSLGVMTA